MEFNVEVEKNRLRSNVFLILLILFTFGLIFLIIFSGADAFNVAALIIAMSSLAIGYEGKMKYTWNLLAGVLLLLGVTCLFVYQFFHLPPEVKDIALVIKFLMLISMNMGGINFIYRAQKLKKIKAHEKKESEIFV